jgi:hypothetical protein
MTNMRAKVRVEGVVPYENDGVKTQETLRFNAVCPNKFGDDGTDENNTYSKWTPTARFEMIVTNPNLFDKFKAGEEYYVDFTPANKEV